MNLIEKATNFAHMAHDSIKHVRKYTGEPYWVHLDEVRDIVLSVGGTEYQAAASELHDYREDVIPKLIEEKRFDELAAFEVVYEEFPVIVKGYVTGLTDVFVKENYPNLNRAQRKAKEIERIALVAPEVKTIKLADLISNSRSIVQHDKDFARIYIREKLAMLPYLSEGNPVLLQQCATQVIAACAALGIEIPMLGA